jgi:hypothetical protein
MTTILILLSLLFAGVLSFFQYFYNSKTKSKVNFLLAFLRFISIFGLLLLLINPIVSRKSYEIVKTPLPIVIDNSSSIIDLKAKEIALQTFNKLSENSALTAKFDIQLYQFDNEFQTANSINFKGKQTNIDKVAKNLKSINKNSTFPTVLITDGNQTSGSDFVYSFDENNKVFPVIVGDTTTVLDLKINQINVNKYAFAKNKFPVEVFLQYSGNKNINANFSISQGNSVLSKQTVSFSGSNKSQIISVLLPAEKVGLQLFKAQISSNISEKNGYNNSKNFAVEVIDQRTNIAIVATTNHPDIGALKRSIESNVQRKVAIVKPNDMKSLADYAVLILYQPTAEFKQLFEANKVAGINSFIITGTDTDFNFLNQQQVHFDFKMSNQKEDYLASFDSQFNLFALDNIGFENFPPLQNAFGTITSKTANTVLLSSKIRNIETNAPLLTFVENEGKRSAYLFGENIWKWRLQSHVTTKSFESFDLFTDKIIQFLASNNSKKSLVVTHENFYNSGDAIEITAQYFNKNYEFDEKAQLTISVSNKATKQSKKYDLLKTNNAFKVNLDGLSAGKYSFSVKELNSNTTYNSSFEILDFDIEKQFVNPDLAKLSQLATQTKGKLFHPNQVDDLIKTLLENKEYQAVQKAIIKKTPFIDWVWLLVLIALSLASEWFIRKYRGML